MRAGACAVQQTLTSEAASVLKHSLTLARRRGHAQVTPLHVAATLLSSRSSLLRRACLKSQPHLTNLSHHHPLQSRALELCFNVALNRLPTSPGPLLHGQPSLSNALIAALKRAQAHQRRGCIEQQQQQPLLTVKVELEQLIISILDDPSVSRVMREAGFSSTAVKTNVEDAASSSVFHCYAGAGVFSSPGSPNAKDPNPNPTSTFWQTHFLTYSDHLNHRNSHINPLLFSSSTSPPPPKKPVSGIPVAVHENDVKLVLEVLTREEKRKNTVIVGDSVSVAEAIALEVMGRAERGEVPGELKFVKLQHLTPVVLRFMKRADVETNISELKRKVDSTSGTAIVYAGDMNWTVETSPPGEYNPADHMVAEVARLVMEYNNNGKKKVWLMATASYQTYMRCQMRQPSLELQWDLHVVSVPSADLSLTLHANYSVHDSKIGLLERKPFGKDDQLCPECKSRYGEEVELFKSSNQHKLLPPWLQPQGQEAKHKDDLEELRKKWNRLCHGLHQGNNQNHLRPILNTNQRVYGRSSSYNSSYPWWPSKTTTSFPGSNSISFVDSPLKPNPSVPRFRKQESCTIEFNFGNGTAAREQDQPSLDCLKNSTEEGKEVRVTLELGNSRVSPDSGKLEEHESGSDCLYKILLDNVPWQSESIGSIVEALSGTKSSGKKEKWLLIQGNDSIGKRRLAHAIAESICGSCDLVLHMNMRKKENEATPSSEILGRALGNHEKLVILVEDVDLADAQFMRFLAQGFETGNLGESWSKRKGSKAVFVLTKSDNMGREDRERDQDSVIQMTLNVSESALSPGSGTPGSDHKRKAAEEDLDTSSKMARQSSFNALDLNVRAGEEEDGELSPISSDLTRETATEQSSPNGFLEAIEDRFVFNKNRGRDGETRQGLIERMRGAYEEVFGRREGYRFSVEERVIEEVIEGSGTFVDSSFEKWLKDVFQTSLKRVRNGGKDGIRVIRLCYGGKGKQGDGVLWDGFMGSSLPKNIHVVSSLD